VGTDIECMIALLRADGTSMVRTAVTLAMLVPLLMPPGVCICHVVVPLSAPTRDENDDHDSALAASERSCCGENDNDTSPCPSDRHDHHSPSCPMLKFVGSYGLVKAENPAAQLMLAHICSGAASDTPLHPASPPAFAPDLSSPHAPLFLTLRTLRI
jgi:hypothetical protein